MKNEFIAFVKMSMERRTEEYIKKLIVIKTSVKRLKT